MRMKRILLSIFLPLGLFACAPTTEGSGPSDRSSYPAGPYGTGQGDTITDLSFVRPDDSPFALSDLFADTQNRLLLVSTAAEWCTACREEQGALESLYQEHGAAGLAVLVAVFEDANFQPATSAIAGKWREDYGLTFDVVADPSFQFADYYDETLTPMNMIVDLDTMEIVVISTGWDPSAIDAIIEARL
jgi:peroxiredoxin